MTEQEIIQACKRNDRKAQELLYRNYFVLVKSLCLRYTQDEDQLIIVINDSFLKVFKNIHQYQARGSFKAWIRKIAYHAVCDYFRKENKYLKNIFFQSKDQPVATEAIHDLYYADLMDVVKRLPQVTREVFVKYAVEGYTHKEIAAQLGFSDGTSKWHLFQARKKMKELLEQQNNYIGNAG